MLRVFVTATTTLLTYILSDPSNISAPADLRLVSPLIKLLAILAQSDNREEIIEMYQSCLELFQKARMAIESSNMAVTIFNKGTTKEQSGQRENVEDFLRRMESLSSGYGIDLSVISPDSHGVERQY